tara:strand:+ start:9894 stop:10295 length:402 start_codon:yes stop_codon:yes gene_type:complete
MRPIKINPKMRGVFTKKAKRKKMSVQKYANYVIKKYKGKKKTKKQLKLLRQAVFAKTAKKWKKRKKTRKKRSKGGDYSPMAKKLLGKKARKLRKATKKIQPVVRGYLTRKNPLPPPKKDYSKMTYQEMMDDDY